MAQRDLLTHDTKLLKKMRKTPCMKDVVPWCMETYRISENKAKNKIIRELAIGNEFKEYRKQIQNDEELHQYWYRKPKPKTTVWEKVLLAVLFIVVGFLFFMLFLAFDKFGFLNVCSFFFITFASYATCYSLAIKNNAVWFGHIMALVITIVMISIAWQAFTGD